MSTQKIQFAKLLFVAKNFRADNPGASAWQIPDRRSFNCKLWLRVRLAKASWKCLFKLKSHALKIYHEYKMWNPFRYQDSLAALTMSLPIFNTQARHTFKFIDIAGNQNHGRCCCSGFSLTGLNKVIVSFSVTAVSHVQSSAIDSRITAAALAPDAHCIRLKAKIFSAAALPVIALTRILLPFLCS